MKCLFLHFFFSFKHNFHVDAESMIVITREMSIISANILKVIKNATGTSVIFPINISFIHFVFVLTSVPNVGECFTKT